MDVGSHLGRALGTVCPILTLFLERGLKSPRLSWLPHKPEAECELTQMETGRGESGHGHRVGPVSFRDPQLLSLLGTGKCSEQEGCTPQPLVTGELINYTAPQLCGPRQALITEGKQDTRGAT